MNSSTIKSTIIEKYDRTADALDNKDWLLQGSSPRIPESKSAHYFIDRKIIEAIKFCDYNENLRVMEIGCSFGNMTYLLSLKFKNLIAVDISPKSVDLARKRLEIYGINNVEFLVDDAEQLNQVKDNSLDVIFSFSTIRFCQNIDDALKSIYNKLADNGKAIIDFPNKFSPWHFILKPLLGIKKHIHDQLYSKKEVIEKFQAAGFKDIEYKYLLFTSRRLPDLLLPAFRVVDKIFEQLPLIKMLAGIIIIKGIKREEI